MSTGFTFYNQLDYEFITHETELYQIKQVNSAWHLLCLIFRLNILQGIIFMGNADVYWLLPQIQHLNLFGDGSYCGIINVNPLQSSLHMMRTTQWDSKYQLWLQPRCTYAVIIINIVSRPLRDYSSSIIFYCANQGDMLISRSLHPSSVSVYDLFPLIK